MSILDDVKKLFFYRQHPETALRYLPIVTLLKKEKLDKLKILEVGSGSYGIGPYLKRRIDGVDTDFSEPKYEMLRQINGSATKLPFGKRFYDVVILSDVLEHIPDNFRKRCLEEAVRVARKAVIISGPFGEEAFLQDQKLASYSLKKLGEMHQFFEEHLKYGLPSDDLLYKSLNGNRHIKTIIKVGEYFNLDWRQRLMKVFITKNKIQYYFYLKGMMLFVPFLKLFNRPPCYRKVFLIKLNS